MRCTPGDDGKSAGQLFYGRPFRGLLPRLEHGVPLSGGGPQGPPPVDFSIGQRVRTQHPTLKTWSRHGTITRISRKNVKVQYDDGGHLWRHRRHVRPLIDRLNNDTDEAPPRAEQPRKVTFAPEAAQPTLRRSQRSEKARQKPARYRD